MSQQNKQQLKATNSANFPNNNSAFITPEKLRDFNNDIIDSVALDVDSQLSGSVVISGSLSVTGAITGDISASTDWSTITNKPSGIVSGSSQVTIGDTTGNLSGTRITGTVANATSASYAITASHALNAGASDWNDIENKPSGLVSGSSQVDYTQITNVPNGIISGSSQVSYPDLSNIPSGLVSSSQQVSDITGSSLVTSSVVDATITFTKGDSSTFDITVDNVVDSTYSQNTITTGKNLEATEIQKGTPLYFTGSGTQGNLVGVYKADAGNPARMPAGGVAGETLAAGAEGIVLLDGYIGGVNTSEFQSGDLVYVAVGGGYTNQKPTGSTNQIQYLGNVEKSAINGSGVINMMGEAHSIPNIQQGNIWIGDANGVAQSYSTSSINFALTDTNNSFTGNQTFNDITVNGTGSFAYIQSVTGSAKIIGDAYIVLNNDTPTERYAGIKVYDSGSADTTASFEFDGSTNDWFYQYSDDGGVTTEHGVALFGPEYSSKGTPTYLTNNTIPKGDGGHHLNNSNITDNGSTITLGSNTDVQGNITVTGSVSILGNLNDKVSLGDNTQVDLFQLQDPAVTSGSTYNVHSVGYQNYPSYGVAYEDAFAIEYADSNSFNHYSGLYMNGGNFTLNLSPSGSAIGKIKGSLRIRENFDGEGGATTELWGAILKLDAIGSGNLDIGTNTFTHNINIGTNNTSAQTPIQIDIAGTTQFTGSTSFTGSFGVDLDDLGNNSQTDLFKIANAESNGNSYTIITNGYQNYPGFGSQYEDTYAVEFADSSGFNYSNGLYLNGGNTTMNLTVSGSPSVSATMRMRDNGDGTANTTIFGSEVDVSAIGGGTLKLGDNGNTNTINIGNNSSITISGSISQKGDSVIDGKVTQTFGAPANNTQIDLVTITGSTDNDGRTYDIFTAGVQDYPSFGASYGDAYVIEKYNNSNYNFGSSMLVSGPRAQLSMQVSGSGNIAVVGARENGTLAQALVSGDETLIIASNGKNTISGSVDMNSTLTASLQEGYVWVGGSGDRSVLLETSSLGGDSFPYTGDAQITGSLGVTKAIGGGLHTLSITSNTASIDLTDSNTYELTLVSSADTHLDVSTFGEDAQSINILVKQPSSGNTGSISFSDDFKFGQGYSYTPTPSNSSEDMLSFLRVGSYLYGTYINNFN